MRRGYRETRGKNRRILRSQKRRVADPSLVMWPFKCPDGVSGSPGLGHWKEVIHMYRERLGEINGVRLDW